MVFSMMSRSEWMDFGNILRIGYFVVDNVAGKNQLWLIAICDVIEMFFYRTKGRTLEPKFHRALVFDPIEFYVRPGTSWNDKIIFIVALIEETKTSGKRKKNYLTIWNIYLRCSRYIVLYSANLKQLNSHWCSRVCFDLSICLSISMRELKISQLKVSNQFMLAIPIYRHSSNRFNSFGDAAMSGSDSLEIRCSNQHKYASLFNFSITNCDYGRATIPQTAFDHFHSSCMKMLFCGETIYLVAAWSNSFAAKNTLHTKCIQQFGIAMDETQWTCIHQQLHRIMVDAFYILAIRQHGRAQSERFNYKLQPPSLPSPKSLYRTVKKRAEYLMDMQYIHLPCKTIYPFSCVIFIDWTATWIRNYLRPGERERKKNSKPKK